MVGVAVVVGGMNTKAMQQVRKACVQCSGESFRVKYGGAALRQGYIVRVCACASPPPSFFLCIFLSLSLYLSLPCRTEAACPGFVALGIEAVGPGLGRRFARGPWRRKFFSRCFARVRRPPCFLDLRVPCSPGSVHSNFIRRMVGLPQVT